MTSENGADLPWDLRRIHSLAGMIRRVSLVLAWVLPGAIVLHWLWAGQYGIPLPHGLAGSPLVTEATVEQRWIGALVAVLATTPAMIALVALADICRQYVLGEVFSPGVVAAFRRLGRAMVWGSVFHWLLPTLTGLAISLTLPPGQRYLTITVSSVDIFLFLVTAVVYLLGAVMEMARDIHEENLNII